MFDICQLDMPQEGVDVLVATPGRVSTLLEAEALNLEDCRAVVLDEVCVPCVGSCLMSNCAVFIAWVHRAKSIDCTVTKGSSPCGVRVCFLNRKTLVVDVAVYDVAVYDVAVYNVADELQK